MSTGRLVQLKTRPFAAARKEHVDDFERAYVVALIERHGFDLRAAAREADLPLDELHALVEKHTRPWFLERVRAFYGEKLDGGEAARIADHLLQMELQATG
jgi:hypothetical protein